MPGSSPARYTDRYFGDVLAKLDPRQAVLDLQRIAGDAEPVLLCWESATSAAWCHRALVSAWLHDTLGMIVPELHHEAHGHGWSHPKLHPSLAVEATPRQARFDLGPSTTPR